MRRKGLQDIIDRELDNFIEFTDDRKEAVTVASCKLFAEHVAGVIQPRPAVQRDVSALVEALDAAARSLETIGRQAGIDEYMCEFGEVRGYAKNRAAVAREALASHRKGERQA